MADIGSDALKILTETFLGQAGVHVSRNEKVDEIYQRVASGLGSTDLRLLRGGASFLTQLFATEFLAPFLEKKVGLKGGGASIVTEGLDGFVEAFFLGLETLPAKDRDKAIRSKAHKTFDDYAAHVRRNNADLLEEVLFDGQTNLIHRTDCVQMKNPDGKLKVGVLTKKRWEAEKLGLPTLECRCASAHGEPAMSLQRALDRLCALYPHDDYGEAWGALLTRLAAEPHKVNVRELVTKGLAARGITASTLKRILDSSDIELQKNELLGLVGVGTGGAQGVITNFTDEARRWMRSINDPNAQGRQDFDKFAQGLKSRADGMTRFLNGKS